MNYKVKELANFHGINENTMQAIYDDIVGAYANGMSDQKAKSMAAYVSWLEERLLHSERMHTQAMEMLRNLMGKLK